jgi:hypothetical protein
MVFCQMSCRPLQAYLYNSLSQPSVVAEHIRRAWEALDVHQQAAREQLSVQAQLLVQQH